ncbi:hypothetical protein KCTC52924_01609 [Arenibacter antarcticus]|uniref:FecR family protein n=1 Tax=Arenibacter antarcticus TaxID=2040469 RepID=A0ABW5VKV5_9FLAO|nr:FecR family protein [Arenibacter sp. H213]MCM4166758.1 hypothetical protein [Arenibacter sp. H213]
MKIKEFLTNKHFIVWMLTKDSAGAKYWEEHLKRNPGDKANFSQAKLEFRKTYFKEEFLTANEKEAIYQRLLKTNTKKPKSIRKYFGKKTKYAIAATLAILVSIGLYYYPYSSPTEPTNIIVDYIPNQENVRLISGDNQYSFDTNTVFKISEDGIINEEGENFKTGSAALNTLIVPYGKRSELVLSDGSKVWINSGSKLKFPTNFSDNHRTILLEGEIYIEVAENKSKPFTVKTPKFKVDVFGTTFNVNAYSDSFTSDDRVVLVEGSVGIETKDGRKTRMAPGESLQLTTQNLIKERVDVDRYISWKNGYLIFNDTPMEKVLLELSRYYNITFSEESKKLSGQTCTGKIYLSNNVSNVIETLSTLTDRSFTIKHN